MNNDQEKRAESSNPKSKLTRKWTLWIALATGFLILIAVIVLPRLGLNLKAEAGLQKTTPTEAAPLELSPALGLQNAPVTIIEYGDFGCSTCWYWYKQGVLDQLRAKYGDKIRFVWRDFPVITLLSPKAAEAGQCAHEQGKFWEFHDVVYGHQGAIEASDLQADAAAIGLDLTKFNDCVSSRRYQERVNAEQHEAFGHGFVGTPAFLINGQPLIGPGSLSDFGNIIDKLLAANQ